VAKLIARKKRRGHLFLRPVSQAQYCTNGQSLLYQKMVFTDAELMMASNKPADRRIAPDAALCVRQQLS